MPGVRLFEGGRTVRRVPISGVQVVEYRAHPGEYYSMSGDVLDPNMAQQAGFDVAAGRQERRRRELMVDAEERIAAQVAKEEAEIEERIAGEEAAARDTSGEQTPDEIHVQPGTELRAVHRGAGKYRVEDAQGNVITDGLTKQQADAFVSDAADAAEEEAAGG